MAADRAKETNSLPTEYGDTKGWIRAGVRDGFPISMGYLAVAFALGISARNVGMNGFQGFLMSLGMVASAGEYAAIMLIGQQAGIIELILTTLVINLRYFLMSCSITQKLDERTPMWKRFLLAYCMTDELFGISAAVPGKLNPIYTYSADVVAVAGWCLGTVLGILAGNILPIRAVSALGVALYGMFLAIVIPPCRGNRFMSMLVLISMAASLLFTFAPLLSQISSGFRVIILTVLIAAIAAKIRPIDVETDKEVN